MIWIFNIWARKEKNVIVFSPYYFEWLEKQSMDDISVYLFGFEWSSKIHIVTSQAAAIQIRFFFYAQNATKLPK